MVGERLEKRARILHCWRAGLGPRETWRQLNSQASNSSRKIGYKTCLKWFHRLESGDLSLRASFAHRPKRAKHNQNQHDAPDHRSVVFPPTPSKGSGVKTEFFQVLEDEIQETWEKPGSPKQAAFSSGSPRQGRKRTPLRLYHPLPRLPAFFSRLRLTERPLTEKGSTEKALPEKETQKTEFGNQEPGAQSTSSRVPETQSTLARSTLHQKELSIQKETQAPVASDPFIPRGPDTQEQASQAPASQASVFQEPVYQEQQPASQQTQRSQESSAQTPAQQQFASQAIASQETSAQQPQEPVSKAAQEPLLQKPAHQLDPRTPQLHQTNRPKRGRKKKVSDEAILQEIRDNPKACLAEAAAKLGITRATLRRRAEELGFWREPWGWTHISDWQL